MSNSKPNKPSEQEYLIHRVFKQNEEGARLLAHWNDNILCTMADVKEGELALAWTEGFNARVKQLNAAIHKVENE